MFSGVFTKETQRKIDRLTADIDALQRQRQALAIKAERLEERINEIKAGQSPIKSGDVIEWESGGRQRRGKVISVHCRWESFEYRCHIITKSGKAVGFANVGTDKYPTLVEK